VGLSDVMHINSNHSKMVTINIKAAMYLARGFYVVCSF